MTYTDNYAGSATRHWRDAEELENAGRIDAASYHYGFAAECAIKSVIQRTTPINAEIRKHFSSNKLKDFRAIARKKLQGRKAARLLVLLTDATYFAHWEVAMRYSKTGTVDIATCSSWKLNALATLMAAGLSK